MFLFLKQTYRYYFSNKHLPILFFLTPLFVVTEINVLSTINHLGNEISNANIGKRARTIKTQLKIQESPSQKLSNKRFKHQKKQKGITNRTSLTQFSNVTNTPFYYSNKEKNKKRNLSWRPRKMNPPYLRINCIIPL